MAYSKVLNRPMFNKHNSAYGRGIASNLVTDEQRQRFNYGGRVGLAQGNPFYNARPWENPAQLGTVSLPSVDWSTYSSSPSESGIPRDPLLSEEGDIISGAEDIDITQVLDPTENIRRQKAKDKEEAKKKKKPSRINLDEILTKTTAGGREREVDEVSDIIDWTPQEKKEKMGQMQLALAERLIGGSRDKWGSTAQMKNLAGALGDVRKITDKEDIRKDQRKYRAAAEMYKDVEEHKLAQQRTYAHLKSQLGKVAGAERAFDVKIKTFGENMKEKQLPKVSLGDIVYDERTDTFKVVDREGPMETWRTIDVTDISKLKSSGALRKLKEITGEEVEETKEVSENLPDSLSDDTYP